MVKGGIFDLFDEKIIRKVRSICSWQCFNLLANPTISEFGTCNTVLQIYGLSTCNRL